MGDFMKKAIIAALTSALLLGGALALPAISAGSSKTIAGCVNNKTQALRIVAKCVKGETKVTWNVQGEQGLQGEPGLQGLQGLQGIQGLPGAAGSNGTSAVNLATNCYQWLMQAQNAGYIWNKVADRSRFESLTGCRVRDININPYAQVPNAISGAVANVTSSKLLALGGNSGEGDLDSPGPAGFSALGFYEITAEKPAGHILCSPNGNSGFQRVFVSPVDGKTYVQASINGNHLRSRTDIAVGSGLPAPTNVTGETMNFSSTSGTILIAIENAPTALALGGETIIRLLSVDDGGANWDPAHFTVQPWNDNLLKLEVMPDEAGYAAVFKVTTNPSEPGLAHLKFRIAGDQTLARNWDNFSIPMNVGVTACDFALPVPSEEISDWTNIYRIYENRTLPAYDENFVTSVGWVRDGWFPDPPA